MKIGRTLPSPTLRKGGNTYGSYAEHDDLTDLVKADARTKSTDSRNKLLVVEATNR
jgi:hypothetical protein